MDKMCVYCESVFTSDTIVCHNCNEYDGMMPLEQAIDYLNLDPNDFIQERNDNTNIRNLGRV